MKVSFEYVIDGINRYLDREIYAGLNDLQEFVARVLVGRVNQNADSIKHSMMSNGFMKTLGLVDSDGMVDIDRLLQDIRREIERQGCVQLEIPMIGKLTFRPEDVDVLRNDITGGILHENY